MKITSLLLVIVLGVVSCGCATSAPEIVAPRPVSHEAALIEVSSPTEWLITATGYSVNTSGDREAEATFDARCAAVEFILVGGTDPLLQLPGERTRFAAVSHDYFTADNISRFISWEATKMNERVSIDDGKRIKIVKDFKVNRELIREDLVAQKILANISPESLGFPTIMVLPQTFPAYEALNALSDPVLNATAGAIESHLTERHFSVLMPNQVQGLEDMVDQSRRLLELPNDDQRLIALAVGSDIYIVFALTWTEEQQIGTPLHKATVVIRAYESTTGRLLGTETGYSAERPSSREALAEEAVNGAITNVIARMEHYWKEDQEHGCQYMLHLASSPDLPSPQVRQVQDKLIAALGTEPWVTQNREILVTERSADYAVWCPLAVVPSAREFTRRIESLITSASHSVLARTPLANRKLAVVTISPN